MNNNGTFMNNTGRWWAKASHTGMCLITLLLAIGTLTARAGLYQEDITVKGVVSDATGVLQGVSIYLKSDTTRGVKTDEAGNFVLKAPANGVLVFSSVGYKKQEVAIRGENVINVEMELEEGQLGEVAVVAF
ncbi:MAG: hypothetical protein EAS52_06725, partial [Parapedobacter sp.]